MLIINGIGKLKDEKFEETELDTLQYMINLYHSLDEVKALGDKLNISEYENSSKFSLDNGKELIRLDMGIPNLMIDKLYEPIFVYKGNYIYVYKMDVSTKEIVSKERFDNCNNCCLRENKVNDYYEYIIMNNEDHLTVEIRFRDNNYDKSFLINYLKGNNDLYEIQSVLPKKDLVIRYVTPLNTETFVYLNNQLIDDIKEGIFPELIGGNDGKER